MKIGDRVVIEGWELQLVKVTLKGNLLLRPVRRVDAPQVVEVLRDDGSKEVKSGS